MEHFLLAKEEQILALKMDLYGNLPPAQGEKDTEERIWIAPVPSSAKSIAPKPAPKAPSLLAFKPRQTSHVPASSRTTATTNLAVKTTDKGNMGTPKVNVLPSVSHMSTSESAKPTQEKENTTVIEEFNNNSSYDVSDPYDPKVPNDYIAYCEERLQRKKAQRVEEENRRLMDEAERGRQQLEEERRDAAQRGDYQSLLMLSSGNTSGLVEGSDRDRSGAPQLVAAASAGRGRGRGLSNLPAWMTQQLAAKPAVIEPVAADSSAGIEQQFQDIPAAVASAVGVKRKAKTAFNKPSCVVLLKNMVAPGEVDDQLGPETQQECARYGPVASCLVCTMPAESGPRSCPDEERVRTFVEFESQEGAVRAFRYHYRYCTNNTHLSPYCT